MVKVDAMAAIQTPFCEGSWEPIEPLADRDEGLVKLSDSDLEASQALWGERGGTIDLAWTESDHRRAPKGRSGGGRFVAKVEDVGMSGKQAAVKSGKPFRRGSRKLLRDLGDLNRSDASRKKLDDRKERTGLTQLARKWNRLNRHKRTTKMREFLATGKKLPPGWNFRADGTIEIATDLSLGPEERPVASYADLTVSDAELEASRAAWGDRA